MKPTLLLICCACLCLLVHTCEAQVNDPNQVARDAATNKANGDMDNAADKAVDKAEQGISNLFKKKKKAEPAAPAAQSKQDGSQGAQPSSGPANGAMAAYQHYDFVPGDKVLFEDNFETEQDGEFPSQWELEKGQAVVNSLQGQKSFYLTDGNYCIVHPRITSKSYLGNVFTLEFDTYNPDNGAYGAMAFFRDADGNELATIQVTPSEAGYAYTDSRNLTANLPEALRDDNYKNRWHHVAIAYKDKQIKVYVDQYRVLTVPNGDITPASFGFEGIGDQTNPIIFRNVRLASGGGMYMVGQKFTEARIVTHGIHFDTDKAVIKPESMGTLNMIVQIMKDNPDLKFEIDGHTDNSGSSPHNMTLSQQRADAVRTQLISMGVSESRLVAKGLGDTRPMADNSTPDGKANNRRVEFVRIN